MRLVLVDNAEEVCGFVARYICKRIDDFRPTAERPFTLGLPTGGTMVRMYQILIALHQAGHVNFRNVVTFNMDEYVGIPRNHPQSYHSYMYQNFFRHIDIKPANVHILNGAAENFEKECFEFERKIESYGGIQLFIGGIGTNGHVAFNEPGSSIASRTRLVTLTEETLAVNSKYFNGDILQVPTTVLTVGIATIMAASEVLLLATGSSKALAVHRAIEKGVNHTCPASVFQMHRNCMFICDESASMELKFKTIKYFKSLLPDYMKLISDGDVNQSQSSSMQLPINFSN